MNSRHAPQILCLAFALALAGCGGGGGDASLSGTLLEPPMPAQDFEMRSGERTVRLSDFRGKLVVLNFGYASCPDVCPTTLYRLAEAMDRIGDRADEAQVVMASVDPERDTPERVRQYAASFDDSFVGVSGTAEETADAAAAFGIYYEKAEGESGSGYLVDHSSQVIVLDRQGRPWLIWPYETTPEAMAADLRELIRRS